MNKKSFEELIESVKQGAAILKGEMKQEKLLPMTFPT